MNTPDAVQVEVFNSLTTATKENGYSFDGMSHREIAEDLISFNSELENFEPEDLISYIVAWLKDNG
jgi:hypothetical protein